MRSDEGHADFTDFHRFFDLCDDSAVSVPRVAL